MIDAAAAPPDLHAAKGLVDDYDLATPAVELDSVERLEDGRIDGPYPGYLIVQRPQVDQRMEDQEYRRQIQEAVLAER